MALKGTRGPVKVAKSRILRGANLNGVGIRRRQQSVGVLVDGGHHRGAAVLGVVRLEIGSRAGETDTKRRTRYENWCISDARKRFIRFNAKAYAISNMTPPASAATVTG